MRHARHDRTLQHFSMAANNRPILGQKYIVIVYDGPDVPQAERCASYLSDAPAADVAKICKAMSEQIRD